MDSKQTLPRRLPDAHKGDFGRILLVGGSRGMAGSIAMSGIAALRMGAGLVTLAIPDRCLETVASYHPCLMTLPLPDSEGRLDTGADMVLLDGWASTGRAETARADAAKRSPCSTADVVACGPGMSTGKGAVRVVERLLRDHQGRRVFDADAINILAAHRWLDSDPVSSDSGEDRKTAVWNDCVLTPHPGELARLTGVPASDRSGQIRAAGELACRTGMVIVVKGGPTVVVGPDSNDPTRVRTWTNSTGNPGMATAGCGDVLTGVVASVMAQKLGPRSGADRQLSVWDAVRLGVYFHGLAGDQAAQHRGQVGMLATDLLDELGRPGVWESPGVASVLERDSDADREHR
ncbi:MAG: NAD(P)H-hydrate dehydratase [Planctomycetota bacterium]